MATCEHPAGARRPDAQSGATLFDDLGGEPTLEELVSGVWEGLVAQQHAACPLCGGDMEAVFGAHARPSRGRCGDCGTTLS
jgi:ribosomal protein S27AE